MPSCGAKVLRSSGDVAKARVTAASIALRSATIIRCPASWPSGTADETIDKRRLDLGESVFALLRDAGDEFIAPLAARLTDLHGRLQEAREAPPQWWDRLWRMVEADEWRSKS